MHAISSLITEGKGILHSILIYLPFKKRKQYFLAFIKVEF